MLRIQTLLLWSRDAQSSVPKIRRALHGLQHVEVTWCHLHTSLVAGFCSACWNHPITYYKVSFKLDLVIRLKTKFDDGKSPFAAYSRLFIKLNVSFKFVEGKPDFSVYYGYNVRHLHKDVSSCLFLLSLKICHVLLLDWASVSVYSQICACARTFVDITCRFMVYMICMYHLW